MKLPKFLICQNEMAEKANSTYFILHTQEPQFLAVVIGEDTNEQYQGRHHESAQVVAYISHTNGLMELYKLVPIVTYSENFDESKLPTVMKRMSEWWLAYLKYEDNLNEQVGEPLILKDFTPKISNLKVITDKREDRYLIIHEAKVYPFESEIDSKIFLYNLGLTDEDLSTGIINIFRIQRLGEN